MDQNTLKWLTPQQKTQLARFEQLFSQPGWADIEKWAKQNADEALMRAAHASSWDQSRLAYGAYLAFSVVAQLREGTEAEYEQFAADAAAAASLLAEESNE